MLRSIISKEFNLLPLLETIITHPANFQYYSISIKWVSNTVLLLFWKGLSNRTIHIFHTLQLKWITTEGVTCTQI